MPWPSAELSYRMIPALFEVWHRAYTGDPTVTDAHGNTIDSWADPIAKRFITWASFANFNTSEPGMPGHARDVIDTGIIVYPDFGEVSPKDRMTVDGLEYEVIGHPIRSDKAWWDCDILNWVINLRKVSG